MQKRSCCAVNILLHGLVEQGVVTRETFGAAGAVDGNPGSVGL